MLVSQTVSLYYSYQDLSDIDLGNDSYNQVPAHNTFPTRQPPLIVPLVPPETYPIW